MSCDMECTVGRAVNATQLIEKDKVFAMLGNAGKLNVGGFTVQFSPIDHKGSRYVDLTMIGKGRFIY